MTSSESTNSGVAGTQQHTNEVGRNDSPPLVEKSSVVVVEEGVVDDNAVDGQWGTSVWWEGGGSHFDHFIDLFGTTTDHLPDVRAYLILMGSVSEPSHSKVPEQSKEEWLLEHGKAMLREAWRRGECIFLDPHKLGRNYTTPPDQLSALDGLPIWYEDLRVHAIDDRPTKYPDVGLRPNPRYGTWDMHDKACAPHSIVKTNLRCPLPIKALLTRPPHDFTSWSSLVKGLYHVLAHPGGIALNDFHALTGPELVYKKHDSLEHLLKRDWESHYPGPIFDDWELDVDDETDESDGES